MQMFSTLQLKHACRKLFLCIWAVLFSPSEHSFSFFYLIVRVNFCALDMSVETLGLWIVTSSVIFIKSVNQSSIKPCLFQFLVDLAVLQVQSMQEFVFLALFAS